MTSQYTTNILNNILSTVSKTASSGLQNNIQAKQDTGFLKALDTSIKNYTDKSSQVSEHKNYDNPTYAERTKSVENTKKDYSNDTKEIKENKNDKKEQVESSSDVKADNNKSEETNKTEKNDKTETKDKIEDKQQDETTSTKEDSKNNDSEESENPTEELEQKSQQNNIVLTAANESIIANVEYSIENETVDNTEAVNIEESQKISSSKNNKDVLMSQTIADQESNIVTTVNNNIDEAIKIDESQLQKNNNNKEITSTENNLESSEKITQNIDTQDIDIEVETKNTNVSEKQLTQNEQTKAQKDAKAALASDNSRIILNLDDSANQANTNNQVSAVTPADTEPEKTPVIKVTDDVAASTKETTTANFVENKDLTSNVKQKAVSQMTALENTETVVTKAQTNAQQNTGNESSLNNQNAGEQVIKMGIDDISQPVNSTESFVNRFNTTLNSATTKMSSNLQTQNLNSSDIMNQVNAKLDELQNAGNNKVSIVLKPENLGRVSLEIMNSKDGIVAKMTTDNQQVKELFDKNVEALKSNLSAQGVNVNNIKVECSQESSNNAMNFERDQFNQQNTHHQQNNQGKQTQQSTNNYSNSSYSEDKEVEYTETSEIKNTETIIQHNGKVDYKV